MMNWKLAIGSAAKTSIDLSLATLPLNRYFPYGVNWLYDVQRIAGTKDLKIIFDVGANVGQTAHDCLRFFPRADIYSFEPISTSFVALSERFRSNPNLRPIRKALGATVGRETIQLNRDSTLNTLIVGSPRDAGLTGNSETVEISTVDQFCSEHSITLIDILKIDVQGYESLVLDGAKETIAAGRVRFIFAEVGFSREDSDIQHFGDFTDLLLERGFRFSGLYDQYRWGAGKRYVGFANALYVWAR